MWACKDLSHQTIVASLFWTTLYILTTRASSAPSKRSRNQLLTSLVSRLDCSTRVWSATDTARSSTNWVFTALRGVYCMGATCASRNLLARAA